MIGGEIAMLLSEIFDAAMWKTNLSSACNKMQYVLSHLKRGESWDDKMQEQAEDAKYVLQVMIVVAKRVGLNQDLTPDENELFGGKWAASQNILDVFRVTTKTEANYLLEKCTKALELIDKLLARYEVYELSISQCDWLKEFFHWLGEPFLLSAHADLAAQRDAPPFSVAL